MFIDWSTLDGEWTGKEIVKLQNFVTKRTIMISIAPGYMLLDSTTFRVAQINDWGTPIRMTVHRSQNHLNLFPKIILLKTKKKKTKNLIWAPPIPLQSILFCIHNGAERIAKCFLKENIFAPFVKFHAKFKYNRTVIMPKY